MILLPLLMAARSQNGQTWLRLKVLRMAGLQQYGKVAMHENTSGDDVFAVVCRLIITINLRIFEALTRVRWRTPNRQ